MTSSGSSAVEGATEIKAQRRLDAMSNWGRWGENDQAGAANTVDAAAVARGVAAIRTHRVVSLGAEIGARSAPRIPAQPSPRHFMEIWDPPPPGAPADAHPFAVDTTLIATHGTTTHVDALCHVWVGDQLYNGFDRHRVGHAGAAVLGMEQMPAIVTRGVLLDVASLRGVDHLADDTVVTAEDLAACADAAQVELQPGDAVLVRTGWPRMWAEDRRRYQRTQPGVGASAGLYLAERDVCLVGADNSGVQPKLPPGVYNAPRHDLHIPLLRNLGIYLLEMLDLEQLAVAGASTFFFCLAPLRISGGTGSPVNPTAVL